MRTRPPPSRPVKAGLAALVGGAACLSLFWVFLVPIFEYPDEPVHFEYVVANYAAGRPLLARDAGRLTPPEERAVPDPTYLELRSGVAVIALQPDVKAPPDYGSEGFFRDLDQASPRGERSPDLLRPILLGYYPFGYYSLDAAAIGLASLFTSSPTALFFAARALSVPLLALSMVLAFGIVRHLGLGDRLALTVSGLVGFFPVSRLVSSSVQPDALAMALVSLALYLALRLRHSPHQRRWRVLLGLSLAMLLVTKYQYFVCVAVAVGGMVLALHGVSAGARSQAWPRLLLALALPSLCLGLVQLGIGWGAPALVDQGSSGSLPDLTNAMHSGPGATAAYLAQSALIAVQDLFFFGRTFYSFWGVFGWLDTPLVVVDLHYTFVIWAVAAAASLIIFSLTLARLATVGRRLVRAASHGHARLALFVALRNPVLNSYFLFVLFVAFFAPGTGQGRYFAPFLAAVFLIPLAYAPRVLPAGLGRALQRLMLVGMLGFALLANLFAVPTVVHRYYGQGRQLATIRTERLQLDSRPGLYEVTAVVTPGDAFSIWKPPPGNVAVVGWAADPESNRPARTVFVSIDEGRDYQAVYGDDSPKAASRLGPGFNRAGFDIIIDASQLSRGRHQVVVKVVSSDGQRLYQPAQVTWFDTR